MDDLLAGHVAACDTLGRHNVAERRGEAFVDCAKGLCRSKKRA
jgi:hypothetical protein